MNINAYRCYGLTLIELMVTVAILAIIAAIAVPAYRGYVTAAKRGECLNELAAIKLAEEEFFLANNRYFDGNSAAALQGNSNGIYQPTPEALAATPNCTYNVTVAGNTYTLTVTGAGELAGEGVIETYTSQ